MWSPSTIFITTYNYCKDKGHYQVFITLRLDNLDFNIPLLTVFELIIFHFNTIGPNSNVLCFYQKKFSFTLLSYVFSCAISPICGLNYPYSYSYSHFCFLVFTGFLFVLMLPLLLLVFLCSLQFTINLPIMVLRSVIWVPHWFGVVIFHV